MPLKWTQIVKWENGTAKLPIIPKKQFKMGHAESYGVAIRKFFRDTRFLLLLKIVGHTMFFGLKCV